jgi:hypothetical protein
MKIRVVLSLLLTGIFSTTALAGLEPPEGEKLITYQPDPEVWEVSNKDLINSKRLVWFSKEMRAKNRTYDDFYELNVFNKPEKNLDELREWSDKKGKLKCGNFESIDLARNTEDTYPSIFWRTTCLKNNAPGARLITKLIEGERHLYQVQKAWVGKVDQADIDLWLKRVEEAFVCNKNSETEPCPAEEAAETILDDAQAPEVASSTAVSDQE